MVTLAQEVEVEVVILDSIPIWIQSWPWYVNFSLNERICETDVCVLVSKAIRMSLQEEEERQRREAGASGSTPTESVNPGAAAAATTETDPMSVPEPITPSPNEQTQAPPHPDSGMHSATSGPISAPGVVDEGDVNMDAPAEGEDEDEDEDAAMLRAIAMSMEDQGGETKEEEKK